jgi:hypothetical protein
MSPIAWIRLAPLFGLLACGGDDARPADDGDTLGAELEVDSSGVEPDTLDTDEPETGPDTVQPDGADTDGGPSTWEERFEAVIPSTGVVPVELELGPGVWREILETWVEQGIKVERRAVIAAGPLTHPAVGVRLKGGNSLVIGEGPDGVVLSGKYPLKLDFNSQGGERLHGVDELGLNSSLQDPSFAREWLASAMFRAMDVEAAKVGFADVTITTGEESYHAGVQPLVQVIDKRFLKHVFGEDGGADDGNLYKCTYNQFGACSLQWLGDSIADYVRDTGCARGEDRCGLVLQTNEDDPALNDYRDVLALIGVLAETDPEVLQERLPEVFDVDHFLRLAAVNLAIANFDSYFGRGHNHYLYRRADGRFQMIPWDFDLSYARGCTDTFENPSCGDPDSHRLVTRILSVPAWRDRYFEYVCEVGQTLMTPEVHRGWLTELEARLREHLETDEHADLEAFERELDLETGVLIEFVSFQHTMLLGACDR